VTFVSRALPSPVKLWLSNKLTAFEINRFLDFGGYRVSKELSDIFWLETNTLI